MPKELKYSVLIPALNRKFSLRKLEFCSILEQRKIIFPPKHFQLRIFSEQTGILKIWGGKEKQKTFWLIKCS